MSVALLLVLLNHGAVRCGGAEPKTSSDCVVTGRVIDYRSKHAVQCAEVQVTTLALGFTASSEVQSHNGKQQPAGDARLRQKAVSGANGAFCIESLPPGQYQLSASKAGYLPSNYGATSPFQSSAILDIDDGQQVKADVQMMPYGVVSGRVTDSDGERVDSGMVQVMAEVSRGGVLRTTIVDGVVINDLGQYRVGGLLPGRYYVRYRPRDFDNSANVHNPLVNGNARRMVATFHPSAASLSEALSVQVGLGEEASNTDIVVRRVSTYSVRGKLIGDRGQPPEFASVDLLPAGEEPAMLLISNSVLGQDGTFVFSGVAPGEYGVVYYGGTGADASAGRAPVTVVDRDVVDVLIQMQTPVTVNGAILVEDAAEVDFTKLHVGLATLDSMGPSYGAFVRSDGSFVLEGCSPGRYTINVMAPSGTHLRSVHYGDSDITRSPMVIGSSGLDLKIVLARGGARLRGAVTLPGGGAPGSAYYLIVPRDGPIDGPGLRFGHTDKRGSFLIEDLQPGPYRAFGLVTLDRGALAAPRVLRALESFGTELELHDGEESTVSTPLISAEEGGRIFNLWR
ncbi:MAG: collagen binding domain-containing protein [Bryobacteraceae bacterium]